MKTIITAFFALCLGSFAFAQYAVNDAATQALLSKQNGDFLNQMATQFNNLDQQIGQFNTVINQGQQMLQVAGNPTQALSFASGKMGLDTSSLSSANGLFQSASKITSSVDSARSLANNAQGIFKSIPSQLPDGSSITRDLDSYKKFDAFEQNLGNFQNTLSQAQGNRQTLLTQLQSVMSTQASSQAEQSEKQARISALSAQLYANDQIIRDSNEQRQAQAEANKQDEEKQRQATQEQINTELKKAESNDISSGAALLQGDF